MMTRKASGCIVFKNEGAGLRILLVTSSDRRNWVIPKGGVELNLSSRESALKEVQEEAGVTGNVGVKLGEFAYLKNGMINEVQVYAMEYTGEVAESEDRETEWFSVEEAIGVLDSYVAVFVARLASMAAALENHELKKKELGII